MYFHSEQIFHALHFVNARRMLEFQQYQLFMEKQNQLSSFDPFEPIRRLAMVEGPKHREKSLTSFRINDILADNSDTESSENISRNSSCDQRKPYEWDCKKHSEESRICSSEQSKKECKEHNPCRSRERNVVRPWSTLDKSKPIPNAAEQEENHSANRNYLLKLCNKSRRCEYTSDDEEEIDVEGCDDDDSEGSLICSEKDLSPLDALVAMSSKTFVGLENYEDKKRREEDNQNKSQIPKKKRKTRTAFTNQQIYELEKRFILQKYLTPSDRDEIASKLGLSCAQVITWFQNRRAKFKRDIEEMKHDVVVTSPRTSESESDNK